MVDLVVTETRGRVELVLSHISHIYILSHVYFSILAYRGALSVLDLQITNLIHSAFHFPGLIPHCYISLQCCLSAFTWRIIVGGGVDSITCVRSFCCFIDPASLFSIPLLLLVCISPSIVCTLLLPFVDSAHLKGKGFGGVELGSTLQRVGDSFGDKGNSKFSWFLQHWRHFDCAHCVYGLFLFIRTFFSSFGPSVHFYQLPVHSPGDDFLAFLSSLVSYIQRQHLLGGPLCIRA